MVVIRLAPNGRKGDRVYKIMVCSKAAKLTGKYIEKLGIYKPGKEKDVLQVNADKYAAWVAKGAQPTSTLAKLLKEKNVVIPTVAPVAAAAPKAPKAEKKAAPAAAKAAPKAAAPAKTTAKKK